MSPDATGRHWKSTSLGRACPSDETIDKSTGAAVFRNFGLVRKNNTRSNSRDIRLRLGEPCSSQSSMRYPPSRTGRLPNNSSRGGVCVHKQCRDDLSPGFCDGHIGRPTRPASIVRTACRREDQPVAQPWVRRQGYACRGEFGSRIILDRQHRIRRIALG